MRNTQQHVVLISLVSFADVEDKHTGRMRRQRIVHSSTTLNCVSRIDAELVAKQLAESPSVLHPTDKNRSMFEDYNRDIDAGILYRQHMPNGSKSVFIHYSELDELAKDWIKSEPEAAMQILDESTLDKAIIPAKTNGKLSGSPKFSTNV